MIDDKTIKKLVVIGSILVLLVLTVMLLWPVLLSIFAGLILAYMFFPLYSRIFKVVREKNISALIIVLLLIFLIFIPIWFLFPIVTRQIFEAYTFIQKVDIFAAVKGILPISLSTDTATMVNNIVSHSVNVLFSSLSNALIDLPNIILQLAVILFVFFFGMRDADKMKTFVKGVSPFSQELEESLTKQFEGITNSVVYGHIIIGVIQGILTGIGLFIFGIPNVLLFTFLAVLSSIIPILGAWLIWVPAVIYLLSSGHTGAGIGLLLYGALFVSWIDNVIRPYIVSKRSNLNSGIVLVGMLGGMMVFGVLGLILGPLILAYLIVLLEAYKNKQLSKFFSAS